MTTANTVPNPGETSDGVEIVEGLAVFTNELRVGQVRLGRYRTSDDGWFDVEYAPDKDGYRRFVMQNGERVATRFDGRSAQERWEEQRAKAKEEAAATAPFPKDGDPRTGDEVRLMLRNGRDERVRLGQIVNIGATHGVAQFYIVGRGFGVWVPITAFNPDSADEFYSAEILAPIRSLSF